MKRKTIPWHLTQRCLEDPIDIISRAKDDKISTARAINSLGVLVPKSMSRCFLDKVGRLPGLAGGGVKIRTVEDAVCVKLVKC